MAAKTSYVFVGGSVLRSWCFRIRGRLIYFVVVAVVVFENDCNFDKSPKCHLTANEPLW